MGWGWGEGIGSNLFSLPTTPDISFKIYTGGLQDNSAGKDACPLKPDDLSWMTGTHMVEGKN